MSSKKEKIFLILSDLVFINIAWSVYYYVRIETGWIPYSNVTSFLLPLIIIYLYWILIFTFAGLYQHWFVRSRFEEFSSVVKAVTVGCFILFFVIFLDDTLSSARAISRFLILIYWVLMVLCVGTGRILIRSSQISLLEKGLGLRNSIIIGNGSRGKDLNEMINKFPQLGYKVLGFVRTDKKSTPKNILGEMDELPKIVDSYRITEALIALETKEKDKLLEILKYIPYWKVNLKILPDTYEIISGMVKTNQIYGVPLIEVMPEIMPHSTRMIKRIMDIFISVGALALLFPLLVIVSVLIKITTKGPLLYSQTRVGTNGKLFAMYKFRSMIKNAEEYGPEWAGEKDPRITGIGRIIRRTYIDEVPQMLNVLKNEMSIVGPRPERPHFVEVLKDEFPYYYKRLSIKPGITGWAQIKHKYDSSLDDVREKLQYDFYYIENMSLKLDLRIMINTLIVILLMKGH